MKLQFSTMKARDAFIRSEEHYAADNPGSGITIEGLVLKMVGTPGPVLKALGEKYEGVWLADDAT